MSDAFPLERLESEEHSSKCSSSEEDSIRRRTMVLAASSPCSVCDTEEHHQTHVHVWVQCVAAGALREASVIMTRYLTSLGSNTLQSYSTGDIAGSDKRVGGVSFTGETVMSALKCIPASVSPSEIVSWVQSDILPHMRILSNEHQAGKDGFVASELAVEMCRRAHISADQLGHPFEAILAAELAVVIASSFCPPPRSTKGDRGDQRTQDAYTENVLESQGNEDESDPAQMSRELLRNLEIQASIWRHWGDRDRPSLDDVSELGLPGLVWRRLWTLGDSEEEIRGDVEAVIEPVVKRFNMDIDDILQSWVQEAIDERVVFIDSKGRDIEGSQDIDGDDSTNESDGNNAGNEGTRGNNTGRGSSAVLEDEEEMTCSLSRLVSVVSLIRSPQRRVASLLLLFQVTAVDRVEEPSVTAHCLLDGDDADIDNSNIDDTSRAHSPNDINVRTAIDTSDAGGKGASTAASAAASAAAAAGTMSTVGRLCLLAQAACSLVEPVAAEALTEAVRLQRIKALAASYGVISFDPRDRHQIRSAASVIALKGSEHSLRDAIEFASSWGTDSADLSGLLVRAVVNRSTIFNSRSSSDGVREDERRERGIRNALVLVPSHRLLAVVEDSCTYLIESLEEICEDASSEGAYRFL